LIIAGSLVVMAGCQEGAKPTAEVEAAGIRQLHEAGTVVAAHTNPVSSPVAFGGALLISWLIPEGTIVAEGDTIIRFDATRFLEYTEQAAGDLAAQQQRVASLQSVAASHATATGNAIAKTALATELAALDLENQRFESEVTRERATLAMQQAEIDLRQARGDSMAQAVLDSLELAGATLQAERLQARLARLQYYVDQMTVVARADGMVVHHRERTEEGVKIYRAGDEVGRQVHLLDITDVTAMKVEFTVHERDRWRLLPGQKVEVALDAYPEHRYPGTLELVERMPLVAEEGSVARQFKAVADLQDIGPRLRPGMSARVTIDVAQANDETSGSKGDHEQE